MKTKKPWSRCRNKIAPYMKAMTRTRSWGVMAMNDCLIMPEMRGFDATVSVAMNCSPRLAGPRGERTRIPDESIRA